MKEFIIIAPHADDELIGCYPLLADHKVDSIIFGSRQAQQEAQKCVSYFDVKSSVFTGTLKRTNKIYLAPDPTYELHPLHRKLGSHAEAVLRNGQAVVFYVTNMLAPYIYEEQAPANKRMLLDLMYPNKSKLWEYDHKYFLFNGFTKWIIP